MLSLLRVCGPVIALCLTAGCQQAHGTPELALSNQSSSVALRAQQSRQIEVENERQLLSVIVSTLQDFGFEIQESDVDSGIVTGFQSEPGFFSQGSTKLWVSVTTRMLEGNTAGVRANFRKATVLNQVQFSTGEEIGDPAIYARFFNSLEQALFLERNEL